eukprot:9429165-Pyramimonas_sp.AAC.1
MSDTAAPSQRPTSSSHAQPGSAMRATVLSCLQYAASATTSLARASEQAACNRAKAEYNAPPHLYQPSFSVWGR